MSVELKHRFPPEGQQVHVGNHTCYVHVFDYPATYGNRRCTCGCREFYMLTMAVRLDILGRMFECTLCGEKVIEFPL